MNNELLEYPVEELLMAAFRKAILMKLMLVGSEIDQELVDNMVIDAVNKSDGIFADFTKTVAITVEGYWTTLNEMQC